MRELIKRARLEEPVRGFRQFNPRGAVTVLMESWIYCYVPVSNTCQHTLAGSGPGGGWQHC